MKRIAVIAGAILLLAAVLVEPDGVMYISDDHAGVIYRVTRRGG